MSSPKVQPAASVKDKDMDTDSKDHDITTTRGMEELVVATEMKEKQPTHYKVTEIPQKQSQAQTERQKRVHTYRYNQCASCRCLSSCCSDTVLLVLDFIALLLFAISLIMLWISENVDIVCISNILP